MDGIERRRKKWNALARAWYLASEWLSTFLPNAVITDAQAIQDYYRERYGKASDFIPYGADLGKVAGDEALAALGLERGRYFLYVSRMEPENHPLEVREAFEQVGTTLRLALVGDAPYAPGIHPPRARHARPAHRDAGRDLRRRATTSCSRTASLTFTPPKWAARIRR